MRKITMILVVLAVSLFAAQAQHTQTESKAMKASYETAEKDVVEVAMGSDAHTTLVAAVKAADLVGALKGEGPFTVFAPTNAAFDKLPEQTLNSLLKPENKDQLASILTYHVVPGNLGSKEVVGAIQAGNGSVELETLQGGTLTAMIKDGNVYIEDENGNTAMVTAVDLRASNGVIHVIDTVVLPQ